MADDNTSLINSLVNTESPLKKGRIDFATAMQKMGFTSVFDIVRLPEPAFVRQLAQYSDDDATLAYDNAMAYAALIARLYREHTTSSGTFQQLAQRSGVRALVPVGPTYANLFKENWDEFCKVGALAAIDSPVAYLSALRKFIKQLEATSTDAKRILLDDRRPDLKDLLIDQESTHTPRPMLDIVNEVLERNLRRYLDGISRKNSQPIHQVLADRRYPFEMPYNFYHHQCQLGLTGTKPQLGELNYRVSRLLPIKQIAKNEYGEVQEPVLQAQRLLCGLSPQQQSLLIEPSVFSNFYLTRHDLNKGWKSAGTTHLSPHAAMDTCYLLAPDQQDIANVNPTALDPTDANGPHNIADITFHNAALTQVAKVNISSTTQDSPSSWLVNRLHAAQANILVSSLKASPELAEPDAPGYTARFNLLTATGTIAAPIKLARQSFTLTLDDEYNLNAAEQAFFKQSYGVEASQTSPLWHLTLLTDFMAHTGLNAEQVEMLLCRRTYAVRLSPNCPSLNPQHTGVTLPGSAGKVLPFPYPNHYGACYVNGTGTGADLYDSQQAPTPESIIRDQFDNAMGLEQNTLGDSKPWRLTKTSLDRLDRLQRMIRLQRWTDIPFAQLDTLIISAIRAEGDANLGMELSENTLRALGVYRYLNQRYGIKPEEFAALLHDLTPYASGENAVPLFDQVFNSPRLFDTPLILDQTLINLDATDAATQKTLLQLCAGLGLQPTEDSLLLLAKQTTSYVGPLKRDLTSVSSLYRQARLARMFGCPAGDLLTLAGLLGGAAYRRALASGRLSLQTTSATPATEPAPSPAPDILDVVMQLDFVFAWLKDSQQTVAQLQQRLATTAALTAEEPQDRTQVRLAGLAPLPDNLRERLVRLRNDVINCVVTRKQLAALGLPLRTDGKSRQADISWFELLVSHQLLDNDGLLPGLDKRLSLVDAPDIWLKTDIEKALALINLSPEAKAICEEKLVEFFLDAHDRQTQLIEGLFQETAKLPPERCVAVIHWGHESVYSLLREALAQESDSALEEYFQRISRHAEIAVQLRLSNSALRLFLVNPLWLGLYPVSNSEPSFSDLYLFERFSHWFRHQSQSEDSLLSYFSLANPPAAKLKNKALRKAVSETANMALARLLEWSEAEVAILTETLTQNRACSMAEVDWVHRCQAACLASGLSAKALLQATDLSVRSPLDAWKAVGDAVMTASAEASSISVPD
ncbi:Tc toxin subunit A [Pseudomonas hamedanensis]|uniref:Toxin n=1 Tax=Pseudomonas hamedanensis TaxID=2745504 RepID=A0A9E6P0Q2_9PSED|nr:Tc toxin subunit A [Pseudomonas hamedanensis]QXI17673.1 hypothetical protein HU739_001370 [Pseudomonas hamedanensis]